MPDAVVIDQWTLATFLAGSQLPASWYADFGDAGDVLGATRVEQDDIVYFLGPADKPRRLLIVDTRRDSGLFADLSTEGRSEAFMRLCRAAHASLTAARGSIPPKWGPWHAGSRLSFFSGHERSKKPKRVEIDLNPRGTTHVFAYYLSCTPRDLAKISIDYTVFDRALESLDDAQVASSIDKADTEPNTFRHHLPAIANAEHISLGLTASAWGDRLTKEQRAFVDCDATRSVRLIGAAGTGKTLSLILKCLRECHRRRDQSGGYRSLFLTFSQNNVEHISSAMTALDDEGVSAAVELKVCTLQALAHEAMRLDQYGVAPISTDGFEGRQWQRWILDEVIDAYRRGDWITRRQRCSARVKEGVESPADSERRRAFIDSVLTEFACVVEPQAVRRGANQREAYLRAKRKSWMPDFQSRDDRICILDLYDNFRDQLRAQSCIGADQLTADYLVELSTNRWDQIRGREGFDTVFVDELHLFNRQERMVPHLLMRNPKDPPIVIMAYDFKQSTRVTFGRELDDVGPLQLSQEMGLGKTERYDLKTAFRYTPEIAEMLTWVDQAIPAAGIAEELGEEWQPYGAVSGKGSGRKPTLVVMESTQATYDLVFRRAQRRSRHLKKAGSVAVLCLSEQLFERYAMAGAYRDAVVVVSDREQLANVRRSAKRFVFSMPEFVAGMQFDTVYLIEANDGEVGDGEDLAGRSLQFVSQVYLGSSRAEHVLEVYASKERGGASKCLRHAIDHNALAVVSSDELADPSAQ